MFCRFGTTGKMNKRIQLLISTVILLVPRLIGKIFDCKYVVSTVKCCSKCHILRDNVWKYTWCCSRYSVIYVFFITVKQPNVVNSTDGAAEYVYAKPDTNCILPSQLRLEWWFKSDKNIILGITGNSTKIATAAAATHGFGSFYYQVYNSVANTRIYTSPSTETIVGKREFSHAFTLHVMCYIAVYPVIL